jgi:cell division protein FtsN
MKNSVRDRKDGKAGAGAKRERGGFLLGLIIGLLVGLAGALGVALYVTKTPVPFLNKVPQRTAEQDAAEAERNKDWNPNAPLSPKSAAKAASGVIQSGKPAAAAPAAAAAPSSAAPQAKAAAAAPPAASKSGAAASAPVAADRSLYFVQVGAFNKPEEAETQHAKVAMLGFGAKVFEREQSGRTVYRVRVGPFDSKEEAEAQQKKIEAAGVVAVLVRADR